MNRDELYAEAKRLEIAGRSKMTKAELEAAITDTNRLDTFADEVFNGLVDITRTVSVNPGKVLGLHFRGRAMGTKHHALIRSLLDSGATRAFDMSYPTHLKTSHTPNSERVQKYAAQMWGRMPSTCTEKPKLTHRQMRRVHKNTHKHAEGFKIYHLGSWEDLTPMGHSLLARTPEGLGIFYKFIKD